MAQEKRLPCKGPFFLEGAVFAVLFFVGKQTPEAPERGRAHDESVERLKADVERLQAAIDRYLILQGRPRRYAVRLNERNEVLALLVLEH